MIARIENLFNNNPQTPKGTVLYIDDDPMNLRALQKSLSRMGYKVIEELDAKAGIVAAQIFQPDVIILDVRMPRLSGPQVAQILRADEATRHIPIVGLTADTSAATRTLCLKSGYTTHLTKPVGNSKLRETIQFVINESQAKL